ncbi:MAG: hypothetical protein ACR2QQ_13210 [Gammaproteobacteria bacterium]
MKLSDRDDDEGMHELRRELRRLPKPPAPPGLLRRLLSIPSDQKPAWRWALVPTVPIIAGVIVVALVVRQPEPVEDPSVIAMQEFQLAMSYVNRGAIATNDELTDAFELGLREAYGISRGSVLGQERVDEGDQDED